MTKTKNIRNWTVMTALLVAVGLIAACSGGTTSTSPTQPEARNFEAPDTFVVASFDCTNVGGTFGLPIIFQNTTTGTVNRFLWEFGDGTKSNAANPIHQYELPGEKLVTLTATGPVNSDTFSAFCPVGEEDTEAVVAPEEPAEGEG